MKMGAKEKGVGREVGRNIDFLGYQFDNRKTLLRKKTKKNFARKMKVKSNKRRKQIMSNYWGQCLHGDCRNLWNKLTNNYMGFAKKGVGLNPLTKDGQRFFDEETMPIGKLIDKKFTVVDFEPGICVYAKDKQKTRKSYAVKIELNGETYKFLTTSHFIQATLDEARRMHENSGNIFPVDDVTIKIVQLSGGRFTYKFD